LRGRHHEQERTIFERNEMALRRTHCIDFAAIREGPNTLRVLLYRGGRNGTSWIAKFPLRGRWIREKILHRRNRMMHAQLIAKPLAGENIVPIHLKVDVKFKLICRRIPDEVRA